MRKTAIGLAFLLLIAGCNKGHTSSSAQAPPFELKDLSGNKVTLAQFKGHPVMLDFWATWCGPCALAAPYMEAFYKRHIKDGVVVLGIDVDEDPSHVYAYVKRMKIDYPILFAGDSPMPSQYGIEAFPSFILIDGAGKAVQIFEGFSPSMPDSWEVELEQLLAKTR